LSAAAALLQRLRDLDIRLSVEGDRLNCSAPKGVLTPELRAELAAGKEEIKALLRSAEQSAAGIPRISREESLPVSHSQQRLWFLRQMDPTNTAYNIPGALRLEGRIDADAFERAIGVLLARHESVRTRFLAVDGQPRCFIDPPGEFRLRRTDLSGVPAAEREARALEHVRAFSAERFDLTRSPLVRVELLKLEPRAHILCIVADHIVCDGWSIGVFVQELAVVYGAELRGEHAVLPPPQTQFVDYVGWHRRWLEEQVLKEQLPFWTEKLAGTLPALQLPTLRPRPPIQTHHGARVKELFPVQLSKDLRALAREEGVTLYMVLLAAFDVLLARHTGEDDIVVGSAIANRPRPELEGMIGFCANNIVMRADLSGDPTVRELLGRIRDVAIGAYSHQDVPFDVLVEVLRPRRELDRAPLFQAMFTLQTYVELALPGVIARPVEFETGTARLDLAVDAVDRPDGLKIYFEYNTDLFDEPAMLRMLGHYRMLLEGFARGRERRIGELELLDVAERAVIDSWNPPGQAFSSESCINELFTRHARNGPEREAVRFEGTSLTYRELNERANQLARYLRARGAQPETRIGLWLDRSLDMVVGLLGILKSGAAYVPLDPAFPRDRIDFMRQDAGLLLLVTQERLAAAADGAVVRIDADWSLIAAESTADLEQTALPGSPAYVIYTSGSTGTPKGVVVEHRSVVNFLESMHREPGLTASDRCIALTTLSFDIAGLEIHGPLTCGGTVLLASRATALDAELLMSLIQSERASVIQATPATWRLLLEAGWSGTPGLKILCGGEALPRELADHLLATGAELWNLYGPTETTIWSTVARLESGPEFPSIGRPIANTRTYVLDARRRPVPIGVPGELYIGGVGVARGYLGRPELTAERFLEDPFASERGARMYRTGDLARWRSDGTLQCLGRADHQLKIRGYRIEPGEIEAALARHPDIAQVVVVARPDNSAEQRLLAYFVARGSAPEPAALRKFLAAGLPEYMIPSVFVALEQLPLTPNGKVDRKALPEPAVRTQVAAASYESPRDELEALLAGIWREVLKLERVGRNDNFFDLGGHSLLVVQVQSRMRAAGRAVQLVDLFQHPTVAALATFLAADKSHSDPLADVRARAARQRAARGAVG
jgi:amino acid adenylation domain-containing protein